MTKNALYAMLWVFVGLVAATDVYWSIINQEQLYQIELNPLGKFILKVSSGDVAPFMGLKVAGTVIVLGVLTVMYNYKRQWAWICMIAMCVVQIFVLWIYLITRSSQIYFRYQSNNQVKPIQTYSPRVGSTGPIHPE